MIVVDSDLLKTVSRPVDPNKENLTIYFAELEGALRSSERPGIGLAAIQIGNPIRMAIMRIKQTKLDMWNPEIVEKHGATLFAEGCLSVPGLTKSIERYNQITLKNGDGRLYVLEGLEAICVQHEVDHMDGITIRDREYRVLKFGRNELCPCGQLVAGKRLKYKKCHLGRETELQKLLVNKF